MSKSGHVVHFVSSSHCLSLLALFQQQYCLLLFSFVVYCIAKKIKIKVILFLFCCKLNQAFPCCCKSFLLSLYALSVVCEINQFPSRSPQHNIRNIHKHTQSTLLIHSIPNHLGSHQPQKYKPCSSVNNLYHHFINHIHTEIDSYIHIK